MATIMTGRHAAVRALPRSQGARRTSRATTGRARRPGRPVQGRVTRRRSCGPAGRNRAAHRRTPPAHARHPDPLEHRMRTPLRRRHRPGGRRRRRLAAPPPSPPAQAEADHQDGTRSARCCPTRRPDRAATSATPTIDAGPATPSPFKVPAAGTPQGHPRDTPVDWALGMRDKKKGSRSPAPTARTPDVPEIDRA